MKIQNFFPKKTRVVLLLMGVLLMAVSSVQAATRYSFTSAPFTTSLLDLDFTPLSNDVVFNKNTADNASNPIGNTISAHLTFSSDLAPDTTTFFNTDSAILVGYGAGSPFFPGFEFISDDPNSYSVGSDRFGTANGNVTTDLLGNIVDWDVGFQLLRPSSTVANIGISSNLPAVETEVGPINLIRVTKRLLMAFSRLHTHQKKEVLPQ